MPKPALQLRKLTAADANPHGYPTSADESANLSKLLDAANALQAAFGRPFTVTSGFRSIADQRRIYAALGQSKVPLGSAHLKAAALDISDVDGSLDQFCLANLDLLKRLGLYLESPERTPRWTHLQILPPRSGNTVFQP